MQRTAQFSGALLGFQVSRLRHRPLPQHRNEGIQLGVVGLDTSQTRLGELRGRHGARSNPGGSTRQSQGGQLFRSLTACGERTEDRECKTTAGDVVHWVLAYSERRAENFSAVN